MSDPANCTALRHNSSFQIFSLQNGARLFMLLPASVTTVYRLFSFTSIRIFFICKQGNLGVNFNAAIFFFILSYFTIDMFLSPWDSITVNFVLEHNSVVLFFFKENKRDIFLYKSQGKPTVTSFLIDFPKEEEICYNKIAKILTNSSLKYTC